MKPNPRALCITTLITLFLAWPLQAQEEDGQSGLQPTETPEPEDIPATPEVLEGQVADDTPPEGDESSDAPGEAGDEDGDMATEAEQLDALVNTQDRFELRASYQTHMQQEEYAEAIEAAEQALRMTESELGIESLELVPVLNELGMAYIEAGQAEQSVQHFERSVGLLQEQEGVFSAELLAPYTGLGMAMQDLGNHEGAVTYFQYGQHITHRHEGVANLEQTELMRSMAQSLLAQEKYTEARTMMLAILKVNTMHYGEDNPELAGPMVDFSKWHRRYGEFRQARMKYLRSLELRLSELPPGNEDYAEALRDMGLNYFDQMGIFWLQGNQANDEIVDTLTVLRNEVSTDDRVLAWLHAGDLMTVFGERKEAALLYSKAWAVAMSEAPDPEHWREVFGRAALLSEGVPLAPRFILYDRSRGEAFAEFSFNVDEDGRPRDIEVVDSNLEERSWKFAEQNFRDARFRPRMVDGQLQASSKVHYQKRYTGQAQYEPRSSDDRWLQFKEAGSDQASAEANVPPQDETQTSPDNTERN